VSSAAQTLQGRQVVPKVAAGARRPALLPEQYRPAAPVRLELALERHRLAQLEQLARRPERLLLPVPGRQLLRLRQPAKTWLSNVAVASAGRWRHALPAVLHQLRHGLS
jgi:hypothetical protein